MSNPIAKIVSKLQTERNVMLEKMAESAVTKWGIENVKLCQQTDNNYGKMTYWFEQMDKQPTQPQPTRMIEAVEAYIDYIEDDSIPVSRGDALLKNIRHALSRAKRLEPLRDKVIAVADAHFRMYSAMAFAEEAIAALDALKAEESR